MGAPASAQADGPIYAGDAGGQRFSPLDQIERGNVARLELAWQIRTGDLDAEPGPPAHMAFQATPILVDGLLVLPTPLGRVLALDPAAGAERWRFDVTVTNHQQSEYSSRGVAQWLDAAAPEGAPCRRRVFAATIESRLFALDAATGKPCTGFGAGRRGLAQGGHRRGPALGLHDLLAADRGGRPRGGRLVKVWQ